MVGSGLYDMKVEKLFVVDTVDDAAELIRKEGKQAFQTLRDKAGPFRYQDVYVFVHDQNGTELVNPASPDLEGQNLLDLKDASGKMLVRETIKLLEAKETGCNTSCPSFWSNEDYVGPAAIVQAHRFIFDSRDEGHEERLAVLNERDGVWRCRTIFNCVEACPRDINITRAIGEVKRTLAFRRL